MRYRHKTKFYKAFYVEHNQLAGLGIEVAPRNIGYPALLLGGTSIPISDRMGLIVHLLAAGYEVASIENPIGPPLDFCANPARDRVAALRHFIDHLAMERGTKALDIVAQSYSAFETIRVLMADPSLAILVRSIILINPPGLNEDITFIKHVVRFLVHHLARGYLKTLTPLFGLSSAPPRGGTQREKRAYARKEVRGIGIWTAKTMANMIRTFMEVRDIVTFRIKAPIESLQNENGYDINIFLQSDDQIVPPSITKETLKNIISSGHMRIVPGGHNDLFFQEWQRDEFVAFFEEIRNRRYSDGNAGDAQ
jgi:hypothetical protein